MAHRAPLTLPRSHRPPRILLGVAVAALLAVVALMFWPAPSPGRPRASAEDPPAASADYRTLVGDWRRWDGDYTLRLRRVDPSGQMQAEYLNPRPIHVFQARAAADKGVLRLFVELRDVGYPGATYNLAYDTSRDSLVGVYYQPAAQQAYQVGFTRASPHGFTGVCPMLQSPLPLPALSAEGRRFHVMAKPVGAACNLARTYCYYLGKDHLGDGGIGRGRMTDAVLETYIRDYIQSQAGPEIISPGKAASPPSWTWNFSARPSASSTNSLSLANASRTACKPTAPCSMTNGADSSRPTASGWA